MKSISETMQRLPERTNIQKQVSVLKQKVLAHPDWQAFQAVHPEVTTSMVDRSLLKIFEYLEGSKHCRDCGSLQGCLNMVQGYQPELFMNGQVIDVCYNRCPKKMAAEELQKVQSLIKSYFIPKDVLSATFEKFDRNGRERFEATKQAADFVKSMTTETQAPKGLYLYGDFGVGKTYLMGAIANALAKKKIQTMLVYTPDFFREMKTSIGDQTVDEKLNVIKKAPVLVLDDIGAETMSSWVRDEILGSILQYRMMEELPTLYTSNYDYGELEDHLAYSQKGGIEQLKAKRIMERIKHFTHRIYIGGENRR